MSRVWRRIDHVNERWWWVIVIVFAIVFSILTFADRI